MSICSAQVLTRANSDLCRVMLHLENTGLTPPERMALIGRIVDEYRAAVGTNPAVYTAARVLDRFLY